MTGPFVKEKRAAVPYSPSQEMCPVEVGLGRYIGMGAPGVEQLRIAVVGIKMLLQHNKSGGAVCLSLYNYLSCLTSIQLTCRTLEARTLHLSAGS